MSAPTLPRKPARSITARRRTGTSMARPPTGAQELVEEGVDVAPLPPDLEGAN